MIRTQNKNGVVKETIQWYAMDCEAFSFHQKTKDNDEKNCPFSMQNIMRGWLL